MDGLMLDTEPHYKSALQVAAQQCGYSLSDQQCVQLVSGRRTDECERNLIDTFGPSFPMQRFRSLWPQLRDRSVVADGIHTKAGLTTLLAFLADHQVPVAVATSSEADFTSRLAKRWRLHIVC
jgi:beta-phosphoglucomutase-like phosphatase (HAD superfamily)